MNYLAHLVLSYPSAGLVVGNFIGDHVRNKDLVHFTKEVRSVSYTHLTLPTKA